MSRALRIAFAAVLFLTLAVVGAHGLPAQAVAASPSVTPSPTLPSDTLAANYAPRSAPGPTPSLAPSLPSDTLEATEPVDSFPTDPFAADSAGAFDPSIPSTEGDSALGPELRTWMRDHRRLMAPPPVRAVLVPV